MPADKYLDILKKYFGYCDFRGIQRDIIESIGRGEDTLGLMPTGGGKSIAFQVPALAQDGMCLVVTPLIALMKDQIRHLRERGIKTACIHADMKREDIIVTLENCIFGNYKFLYVSPERLASELFIAKLRHMDISFITIDEAHCISQWGHDFRPSYLQIKAIRKEKPTAPILALTASATQDVISDIQEQLGFRRENVIRMSYHRPNIVYTVQYSVAGILGMMRALEQHPGSCIVYTRNRKKCMETAQYLTKAGYSATYYHAGLSDSEKDARQKAWTAGNIRIMVATNAFGMGIDKPDVRIVIHLDPPDSIEAYFQEAGRAGRDGNRAYAILIAEGNEARLMKQRIEQRFPPKDKIREVYEKLCYFLQLAEGDGQGMKRSFDIMEFCTAFHIYSLMAVRALELLTDAGYIDFRAEESAVSRIYIPATRHELYNAIQGKQNEDIITSVLRNNFGVFSQYCWMDESLISRETGYSQQQIYECLTRLSGLHIVHYIPKKHASQVVFLQNRVRTSRIALPKEIYETRKKRYERQVNSMLAYIQNNSECRTRLLLGYFGEKHNEDCMMCDNCQRTHFPTPTKQEYEDIRQCVMSQMDRNKPFALYNLKLVQFLNDMHIDYVLQRMVDKGELIRVAPFEYVLR